MLQQKLECYWHQQEGDAADGTRPAPSRLDNTDHEAKPYAQRDTENWRPAKKLGLNWVVPKAWDEKQVTEKTFKILLQKLSVVSQAPKEAAGVT